MQAAKEAISNFTSHKGHHTDVDETVRPAVTQEQVKPHRHEEITQAVDREVHQHHTHTTVQPIAHEETLPEKHTHNVIPTEHREIVHENPDQAESHVQAHLAQFQPSSTTQQTTHSVSAAPMVTGEHVHHHVHENVIPVIHKSTIQPEVVHTTQPIHETHHVQSQHHGVSALPMKTLDEFTQAGGKLDGSGGPTHEKYDGAPRAYNSKLETTMEKLGFSHGNNQSHAATGAGVGAAGLAAGKGHGHTDSGVSGVGGRQRRGSSSSASSSDYEYAADGKKVKKNRLGGLLGKKTVQS